MIYTDEWLWLHFPKCGGVSTAVSLMDAYREQEGLVADDLTSPDVIWHDSIAGRSERDPNFSLGDRKVLCGIRRLPNWLLSVVHYEISNNQNLRPTREMFEGADYFEASGRLQNAENLMKIYSRPRVDYWIRTEKLFDDLNSALHGPEITPPSKGALNERRIDYIADPFFWFTRAQMFSLYDRCPTWAQREKEVYGALLFEL